VSSEVLREGRASMGYAMVAAIVRERMEAENGV